MSNVQHGSARLEGYEGPFFPDGITETKDFPRRDGHILNEQGRKVDSFVRTIRPTTSDGYAWFWAQVFEPTPGQEVVIAYPWAQDYEKSDGTQHDRSRAVYTKGNPPDSVVAEILAQLG